jgi:PAS domain S-box-containing protein
MNQWYAGHHMTDEVVKNAGDTAEVSVRELDAIIDSVDDGIYVTDGEGVTLRVNKAFERVTGLSMSDLIGRTVHELVASKVYEKAVTLTVLKTGRSASMVETLPNGREVVLSGRPVFDESGRIFRVVTTLRDMEELRTIREQLSRAEQSRERYRRELVQLKTRDTETEMVVSSPAMVELLRLAARVAQVDSTVLISGESGVGKELVARAIHAGDGHDRGSMVTANCGAIPEPLLESELFGYEKGAFTGAERQGKPGLFELAEGGTLFLDEVGELSLNLQVKILRALQEKEITRLGGYKPKKVNVRIIAATNRELKKMVSKGSFRQDLYYRLNVVPMTVPPLRERPEEVLPLTEHFLRVYNARFGKQVVLSAGALRKMENYPWPGNVRELQNTVERMVVLSADGVSDECDLPETLLGDPQATEGRIPFMPLEKGIAWAEEQLLREARRRWTTTRAMAEHLGVSQSTVVRRMGKYKLG